MSEKQVNPICRMAVAGSFWNGSLEKKIPQKSVGEFGLSRCQVSDTGPFGDSEGSEPVGFSHRALALLFAPHYAAGKLFPSAKVIEDEFAVARRF